MATVAIDDELLEDVHEIIKKQRLVYPTAKHFINQLVMNYKKEMEN